MANWTNICQAIKYADKTTEMTYQKSIKDLIFENCLGWREEQIVEQPSIQLGSIERLIPDIVVKKNSHNIFVIEIKKPGHVKTQRNIEQLVSYMKQLETPVGLYIGNEIEVYYKNLGDGSQPTRLMSLDFNTSNECGDDFVELFNETNFSIENISKYLQRLQEKIAIEKETEELICTICNSEFTNKLYDLVKSAFEAKGKNKEAISKALEQIIISVNARKNVEKAETIVNDQNAITQPTEIKEIGFTPNTTARNYGYNLVRRIIERNRHLTFPQLFAIFGKKGYIADFSNVPEKNRIRWFMDKEDCITAADGTRVVISNQWGYYNSSKPKMDRLKEIARKYGIDIN